MDCRPQTTCALLVESGTLKVAATADHTTTAMQPTVSRLMSARVEDENLQATGCLPLARRLNVPIYPTQASVVVKN